MAHRYDASIILVQVIAAADGTNTGGQVEAEEKIVERTPQPSAAMAEAYLSTIQQEFTRKHIESKVLVGEGPIVAKIIEIAEHTDADLIAMASHGRTGLGHVFYGSVAAGILHRIDRPLFLIRSG
jgi:nucleotide-binding universal stress UspA family protein